jgi:hypothetical protein
MAPPLVVRCLECRATHGITVYRLKQNARIWINYLPEDPEPYEAKPERIDLTQSKTCARCSRPAPRPKARKPEQGRLF